MEDYEAIISLLDDVLGKHKHHFQASGQVTYDCPYCSDIKGLEGGDGKGNLEISYIHHIFNCWACGDSSDMHGQLWKLINKYGSGTQKKLYRLIQPYEFVPKAKIFNQIKLPSEFIYFSEANKKYPPYKEAINYLKSRGITDSIIDKYKLGFVAKGEYQGRIIVPSYDENNELNYFIARSWSSNTKFKYKNPKVEKETIIFNEHLINWDKDIYLVEGVFDCFFLDNSIPLLGKHLTDNLFGKLYSKSSGNIIVCLDGDAFNDAVSLYRKLNGGVLYERIKIIKLPQDKDVCDLRGDINEYYYNIR